MAGLGDVLRGLGSVLNPQVMQAVEQEESQNRGVEKQVQMMLLQQKLAQQSPEYQLKLAAAQRERAMREELANATTTEERRAIALKYASPDALARMQSQRPTVVGPGATAIGPDGQPIYTAPRAPVAPQRPTVVAPGSTVLGADGQPIYTAPPKPAAAPAAPEIVRLQEYAKNLPEGSAERKQVDARIQYLTTRPPAVSVTNNNRAEGAYAQKVAGSAAERDQELVTTAQDAIENITKLNGVISHLKTSDAITGLGAELFKNVERARALFASSKAAGKAVSDTELLNAMLGSDVFPMIKALGIGARGLDTPAEREFLREVMSGTITMNKDTLIRMTEIRRNVSQRAIEKYNQKVESGELDRYFQYSGARKQKISIPTQAGTAPSGVEQRVWDAMTPDERKLWQ